MSRFPPDVAFAKNTDNISNVLAARTVVAAPGVGRRIRVWAWGAATPSVSPGAGVAIVNLVRAGVDLAAIRIDMPTRSQQEVVPGGIAYPENAPVEVSDASSTAGPHLFRRWVWYTVEPV